MSVYDITGFLRTAYRPFAYCEPSKHPLNTAYQKGGVTLNDVYFPGPGVDKLIKYPPVGDGLTSRVHVVAPPPRTGWNFINRCFFTR